MLIPLLIYVILIRFTSGLTYDFCRKYCKIGFQTYTKWTNFIHKFNSLLNFKFVFPNILYTFQFDGSLTFKVIFIINKFSWACIWTYPSCFSISWKLSNFPIRWEINTTKVIFFHWIIDGIFSYTKIGNNQGFASMQQTYEY